MRVLKNNFYDENSYETYNNIQPYPRQHTCDNCKSVLEYERADLVMGEYGCMYLNCPLCGYDNMLEYHEDSITLTKDNIEFPLHFHHVSKETGAKDCCNNEMVREYISKAINYFRKNKEEFDWGQYITGNFYIHVHRYSGDEIYDIVVSNNFYTMEIPFESEDY